MSTKDLNFPMKSWIIIHHLPHRWKIECPYENQTKAYNWCERLSHVWKSETINVVIVQKETPHSVYHIYWTEIQSHKMKLHVRWKFWSDERSRPWGTAIPRDQWNEECIAHFWFWHLHLSSYPSFILDSGCLLRYSWSYGTNMAFCCSYRKSEDNVK